MIPFHLQYTLTRRQRLAVELYPWLPAIAGTIGFVIGALYLVPVRLGVVPPPVPHCPVIIYRGLFAFLVRHRDPARQPVDWSSRIRDSA